MQGVYSEAAYNILEDRKGNVVLIDLQTASAFVSKNGVGITTELKLLADSQPSLEKF